jgi:AcrR family transcriptional regulator
MDRSINIIVRKDPMSTSRREGAAMRETPPDRRARRRQQRADEVYQAAIALFMERGYDNTTMDDISDRADVARTSVFNYYPKKSAFLDEWIARRRVRADTAVHLQPLDQGSIEEILGRYLDELARVNVETRAEAAALMAISRGHTHVSNASASSLDVSPLDTELAAYVLAAADRGEIRTDVDAGRVGLLLANGYFASVLRWLEKDPSPFDLREELRGLLDIVLRGVLR